MVVMKKASFGALLAREFIGMRKMLRSYIIISLLIIPMPFIILLSFRHGNLGALIPEDAHWVFLGMDGYNMKLFSILGGAMITMGSSENMAPDISVKWDHFRRSTPVTPARMALAKMASQGIFSLVGITLSLLTLWLMDLALGVEFSAADAGLAIVTVAAITLFSVLALLFMTFFGSVDKGMIALLGVIMVVTFALTFGKEAPAVPHDEKMEQAMQIAAKAQDFCAELLPFLPLILIGTLTLGFIALTLLLKRREK